MWIICVFYVYLISEFNSEFKTENLKILISLKIGTNPLHVNINNFMKGNYFPNENY